MNGRKALTVVDGAGSTIQVYLGATVCFILIRFCVEHRLVTTNLTPGICLLEIGSYIFEQNLLVTSAGSKLVKWEDCDGTGVPRIKLH